MELKNQIAEVVLEKMVEDQPSSYTTYLPYESHESFSDTMMLWMMKKERDVWKVTKSVYKVIKIEE